MDDDIDATRAAVTTNDKLLDDLARRLHEAAESDSVSLKEEAIMMMELLNQARFMQEETKRTLMLAQAHEAKMKKMVEEQEQAALVSHFVSSSLGPIPLTLLSSPVQTRPRSSTESRTALRSKRHPL